MAEVHHFIFNELQVAIRNSVPIKPLLDDLLHYKLISLQEKDSWKSQGKKLEQIIGGLLLTLGGGGGLRPLPSDHMISPLDKKSEEKVNFRLRT